MRTFTELFKGQIEFMLIAVDAQSCILPEGFQSLVSGVYEMTRSDLLKVLAVDRETIRETQVEIQVGDTEPIVYEDEELVTLYDQEGLPDCACMGWLSGRRPMFLFDAVVVK